MPQKSGKNIKHRPPRIRVPRQQKAIFTVGNEKRVGIMQRLSSTGGSALLTKDPIPQGTLGELLFATAFGKVKAHIEFLHKGADGVPLAQAFAFVTMDTLSSQRLGKALQEMNTSAFSDDVKERTQIGLVFESVRQSVLSGMHSVVRRTRPKD